MLNSDAVRGKIMAFMRECGAECATAHEVAKHLGKSLSSVRAYLRELKAAGYLALTHDDCSMWTRYGVPHHAAAWARDPKNARSQRNTKRAKARKAQRQKAQQEAQEALSAFERAPVQRWVPATQAKVPPGLGPRSVFDLARLRRDAQGGRNGSGLSE
jgi:DNA-binding transcriptional ArsR family regulator